MKKIIYLLIFAILLIPNILFAEEKEMHIYLFYGDGCPHCAKEEKFLENYLKNKPYIKLHKYEVWHNQDNALLLKEVSSLLEKTANGVPFTVIGEDVVVGSGPLTVDIDGAPSVGAIRTLPVPRYTLTKPSPVAAEPIAFPVTVSTVN